MFYDMCADDDCKLWCVVEQDEWTEHEECDHHAHVTARWRHHLATDHAAHVFAYESDSIPF